MRQLTVGCFLIVTVSELFFWARLTSLRTPDTDVPESPTQLPACDLIPHISSLCFEEWQEIWSCCVNNKLYSIYPTVGTVHHNKTLSRHEAVIINRLRIGHARLTHSYLLSGDDQPTCNTCGYPLTVQWTVQISVISDEDISLLRLSETYSKALTIVPSLILSKKHIFILYCSFCSQLFTVASAFLSSFFKVITPFLRLFVLFVTQVLSWLYSPDLTYFFLSILLFVSFT